MPEISPVANDLGKPGGALRGDARSVVGIVLNAQHRSLHLARTGRRPPRRGRPTPEPS